MRGFTVLECLVALAIAALLMTLAVPAWRGLAAEWRLRAATGALHSTLLQARHEAIHAGIAVLVCPGSALHGCQDNAWDGGWIGFQDTNGNRQLDADETLLRMEPAWPNVNAASSAARRRLRFLPNGTAPGSNATLRVCDAANHAPGRRVTVSSSGRIRSVRRGSNSADFCTAST